MLLIWTTLMLHLARICALQSNSCDFNSMCTCTSDQYDPGLRNIHTITCLSVPFYKFPNLPAERSISQLEVVGSKTVSLEAESLAGCQVQALVLANNRLQHVADRAFSSLWKSLTSLDLSYNQLDSVPFLALKELRSLQWINLHGNQISSIGSEWSHVKNTLTTLFLGENDITEVADEQPDHSSKVSHGLREFKSLIWVNLDGNRMYKIHKHSLPLTLQTASISHNLIENFPLEIVSGLPHLQWLYLRGNHIKTIPEHTFARKVWLEKIDLGENYLKSLPRSPFNSSVYIRDLNLAFNDFKTLSSQSFAGLQCGRIILSYNMLEDLEIRTFEGIEDTLEYLDFDHNNFQRIPYALGQLNSLKYLYLSSNLLSEIPERAFDTFCSSLKAVSLSGNRLTRIPVETLQNCSKISHFNIGFNEIYEIGESDFSWGSNIKSLILGNNRITSLKSHIFADLQQLKELSLSFNPLRVIDSSAFAGLEGLESLEVSFGLDRDDLPHEIFKPLTNLKWLSVDNNNFDTVPEFSLDSLPELKYLNIESNKIRTIPINLLKPAIHSKLKDIRLSNNEISTVRTDTFKSLNSLETVLLSNNRIRAIEADSFNDLPALNKLILANNLISKLHSRAFSNLPSLAKLDLQNNFLSEFSFGCFANLSAPLHLNLSRNQIISCNSDLKILNVHVIDLRYNNLARIPKCLENTALLKKLHLDFNIIARLDHNSFMHLTSLEQLSLQQNNIMSVSRKAFAGLQNLQILDLSKNLVSQLHPSQFANMPQLRVLDLSSNSLNYLPKDVFQNTVIEMLDLSYNSFSVVPSLSLSDVGLSLRHLSISSNNIEHIDSTTFPDIPFLHHLNLSNNKLTILPDNVFTSLGLLQVLDLSSNPLRANFKELFHYAQSLKHLNLANSGITSTPHLPLPNMVHLNLSHNHIEAISKNSVQELGKLKSIDLSHNQLFEVPAHLWIHLPRLKSLDLSFNPIKEIVADSFYGLSNLQDLNIQGLRFLDRFESKAIQQIKILNSLAIQTWPNIDNFNEQFCNLMANLQQLRILKIHVMESVLDEQLLCVKNKKIRHLEITGRNLKMIDRDAFVRFGRNPDLVLRITGTEIEELPPGLFSSMYKVSYLTIDLRNNMLSYLSPEIFYGNTTTWKNVGTTLISGGLTISENPFRCGCHLAWLGHWLRRWTRESLQSHNAPVETAMRMNDMVKEATCTDITSGTRIPIVQLPPEDMSCHASALSDAPNLNKIPVMFVLIYLMTYNFVLR
nr:PREDICTED: chaoptin isoform X2 [Tribolium castaneum]XP_015833366.1 PREDICTED: chaoptin isoform X2 [Tribolium castaneum]XP_015833367.1 PREDICTED: chaoptin isoform X2 [Tribolium castaneum]XP_015833368.1 PREDICTED: chaoptin isoform X2 [Tribolium castaneum]XP_015833369.1 PREDICTED: chaoptin isoform X2 [Tribolium castaneum]|eukprot:XP_015833364.1 PREDICTED: chaoptin isoform X2 [Tribolium castaneum]